MHVGEASHGKTTMLQHEIILCLCNNKAEFFAVSVDWAADMTFLNKKS